MKKLLVLLFFVMTLSLIVISDAIAADTTKEGVDAIVKYDPLGPNNLIGAFVQFVNHNAYKVRVIWTPVITCSGSDKKEGYGEPFIMNKGESYQATIWRAGTCGNRKLENLSVEMNVEKATE